MEFCPEKDLEVAGIAGPAALVTARPAVAATFKTNSHSNIPKEAEVGTTRRVVRERRLSAVHIQPDGPAVRPYHPNVRGYYAFEREMV